MSVCLSEWYLKYYNLIYLFFSALATLGAFASGVCLAWSSSALPMLAGKDAQVQVNASQGSWIGSIITLGAVFGAIPAGTIVNLIGRKRTLQALGGLMLLSWVLIGYR